ncbi:MAG: peptidoglycan-binding protein LysM [Bacteroidia bacterium]|nr:peptidoglycan-binding protein LysM [Bacteroidia bacterium]
MGLFSFIKNLGSRSIERKEESEEHIAEAIHKKKVKVLTDIVHGLNLNVTNLSIDLKEDVVTVYGQVDSTQDREKVVLALGNTAGVAAVDDRLSVMNPEPEAEMYEVKKGDSLSKIAKRYYGDPMKYKEIFAANQPMLQDPNLIYPGQVLRIPNL